jgi:molecular chaperone DnaJ
MPRKDYYKILGIDKNASADDIKKAFRKMAQQCHPDKNPGNKQAEEKFKDINEAYQALSDADKRKQYDDFGFIGGQGYSPGPGAGAGPGRYSYTYGGPGQEGGFNFEDIFSNMGKRKKGRGGSGFGDIFSDLFGAGGGPGADFRGQEPGESEAELEVDFMEALKGGTRTFQIGLPGACYECGGTGRKRGGSTQVCPVCQGSGKRRTGKKAFDINSVCPACGGSGHAADEPCPGCGGTGRQNRMETITVRIPAGVRDGGRLRIPGKGQPGPGGRNGDLMLNIRIRPHRYFKREENDIHVDVPVTLWEAALGATIEVPTIDGQANLKVPAGTQSGHILRLRGKGAPDPKNGSRGDEYVHISLTVPKKLDEKTKKLLEELAKSNGENPRKDLF